MIQLIPAIDLQQGQCVRLRQGRFDEVRFYPQSPTALARHYASQDFQRLHVVDLDGARQGQIQQLALIQTLRQTGLTLQVGGGIRSLAAAQSCLEAGIDQLVIGSLAVTDQALTQQLIREVGAEKLVLALDVHVQDGLPIPATHGWQTPGHQSLWDLVEDYRQCGIKDILCTDIASDGMMNGPNIHLYQEALLRFPDLCWQASGGIRHPQDLDTLNDLGVSAAIVGRALYEGGFEGIVGWAKER